jgi:two-component system response regulator AtoC
MGKPVDGISQEALKVLENYSFPGNVRELQNIIERAIALTTSSVLQVRDLPRELQQGKPALTRHTLIPVYVGETLEEVERKVILHNLSACNGNRRKTAQVIGIGERTLRDKLKKYQEE